MQPARRRVPVADGFHFLERQQMNDEQTPYPAEILTATERHFEDSGNVLMGRIEVTISDRREIVNFRIDQTREVIRRILFQAAGLAADAEPEQLVGRRVRVVLGDWTRRDGTTTPVVRKWLPAESKPRAARPASPAAKPAPAWERDEQKRPPRTPAARVRASIERAGGEFPDDEIPF
jgi:hypothetical protein